MSNQINTNILKSFIVDKIGGDKLEKHQAQKYDIEADEFDEANTDENNYLELDEILEDSNLYEKFATMFVEEHEKADVKDTEKEKEEETKVKDKNGAGM